MKKDWWIVFVILFMMPFVVAGCVSKRLGGEKAENRKKIEKIKEVVSPLTERQCLMRAMYFESNRSSREGMIAVGTVVMNRVNSSAYPKTICGVVGQRRQFAPGVLTRPMIERASVARVEEAADAVLRGERDGKSKNAMFFHTAGLSFGYKNIRYVRIAGGNAFYEKRARDGSLQVPVNDRPYDVALAFSQERSGNAPVSTEMARANEMVPIPFAVAQLDKIPIPVRTPDRVSLKLKTEEVVAYAIPSPDKLSAIVSMLEERYRNW